MCRVVGFSFNKKFNFFFLLGWSSFPFLWSWVGLNPIEEPPLNPKLRVLGLD